MAEKKKEKKEEGEDTRKAQTQTVADEQPEEENPSAPTSREELEALRSRLQKKFH